MRLPYGKCSIFHGEKESVNKNNITKETTCYLEQKKLLKNEF